MAEIDDPRTDQPVSVRSVGRDVSRYAGPEGEVDFVAFGAMHRGQFVHRNGHIVEAIDGTSLRWAGGGQPLASGTRESVLERLRAWYRGQGIPYQLRLGSGEIETETGERLPGFRSALPEARHSDGWSLTDLFMSPDHPDPDSYPPTVVYSEPGGRAELPRDVPTIAGERRRVLRPAGLRWLDDRTGEALADADRDRIMTRIRSVYEQWGIRYDIVDD